MSSQPLALRLFFSPQRNDLLVVYDEYPLEKSSLRTRAYWLYETEDRVGQDGHVTFVKTNSASDLVSVPVLYTTADLPKNAPESLFAVTTNDYAFAIYSGQREVSTHCLPIHFVHTGNGIADKIAVTPLAMFFDGLVSKLSEP